MTIQLNTDKNVAGDERVEGYVNALIEEKLSRFSDQITRIEVHLSDQNGQKEGENDKRCMLEARFEGKQPIAVTSQRNTVEESVNDALDKLMSSVETNFDRQGHH